MNRRQKVRSALWREGMDFHLNAWRRDWTNLSFWRHGGFDSFIVTMHQSGSHWVKHVLSQVIARHAGLPPLERLGESLVVGGPKDPARHAVHPRVGMSHTIPSPLIRLRPVRVALRLPRYCLLVRDIRSTLVSHYEKWKGQYGVPFSVYLRGDPGGRRYDKDIWWDVRFLNSWGRFCRLDPQACLLLRYEDLRADPEAEFRRLLDFIGLDFNGRDELLHWALTQSTKERMAGLEQPQTARRVVRLSHRHPHVWYQAEDRDFLQSTLARYLRFDAGYDYARWGIEGVDEQAGEPVVGEVG